MHPYLKRNLLCIAKNFLAHAFAKIWECHAGFIFLKIPKANVSCVVNSNEYIFMDCSHRAVFLAWKFRRDFSVRDFSIQHQSTSRKLFHLQEKQ